MSAPEAERIALRVADAEGGQRVDKFLAEHSLLSRSAIARLARDGHVRADGAAVEPAYKVRGGQELVVDVPALVIGDPGETEVVIEAPVERDSDDRRRMVVRAGGREAVTRFKRIASWENNADPSSGAVGGRLSLLLVKPVTGRTHQIRVHLAYAHFPIVGDPVYGRRGDTSGLGRQFLHAWRLTVRLPHAGERTFTAPLAPDLRAYLATLGTPATRDAKFAEVA